MISMTYAHRLETFGFVGEAIPFAFAGAIGAFFEATSRRLRTRSLDETEGAKKVAQKSS
jgi:hypothetical protein